MNAMLLRSAARRNKDFLGQFANPCITQPSGPAAGLHKNLLANDDDILSARGGAGLQSRLAGCKVDVCGSAFVDTRRERDNQDGVGSFMKIPRVHRYDNHRPTAFIRRIRR